MSSNIVLFLELPCVQQSLSETYDAPYVDEDDGSVSQYMEGFSEVCVLSNLQNLLKFQ